MDERVARDPFYDMKPERAWIGVSNMTEDRKLRVLLEINGVERELFRSALPFDEGNILQHSNITWLINSNKNPYEDELTRMREELKTNIAESDARIKLLREQARIAREGLEIVDGCVSEHCNCKDVGRIFLARLDALEGEK